MDNQELQTLIMIQQQQLMEQAQKIKELTKLLDIAYSLESVSEVIPFSHQCEKCELWFLENDCVFMETVGPDIVICHECSELYYGEKSEDDM